VIHNGLSDPATRQAERDGHGRVRIGIVGQVSEWKGHRELLKAFAMLKDQCPGSELHVYGTGSDGFLTEMKQHCEMHGISAAVFWHGFQTSRDLIYGELDLLVVPSKTPDPLPTSAIEAAFFRKPCIVTECGGLPEIVDDQKTGFVVPIGDIETLALRITQVCQDESLRYAMGQSARKKAVSHFGSARFVREFDIALDCHDMDRL
jgi:glycosyltransferase involved in cell wall biosynthesis